MIATSAHRAALRFSCLPVALALAGALGCTKNNSSGSLYVWDDSSSSVQVWKDVDEVYNPAQAGATDTTIPAADRTITFPSIVDSASSFSLGWGGMALDTASDMLYLVSTGGVVTRISNASTKNGAFSSTTDVLQFNLGSSSTDRFSSGSEFGQASVYPGSNTLYVMETSVDGTGTRVWVVPSASSITSGYTFTPASSYTDSVQNDTWGSGLAAGAGGYVYGLFGGGTAITDPATNTNVSSPRLRRGSQNTSGLFPYNASYANQGFNVLFGTDTGLASPLTYGSLAFDGSNNALYVFAQPATALATTDTAQIEVFNQSLFNFVGNYAPSRTLASVPANLRIIAHPLSSDWLLGATYTPTDPSAAGPEGTGSNSMLIWKSPSGGGTPTAVTLPGTTEIRGMAMGDD